VLGYTDIPLRYECRSKRADSGKWQDVAACWSVTRDRVHCPLRSPYSKAMGPSCPLFYCYQGFHWTFSEALEPPHKWGLARGSLRQPSNYRLALTRDHPPLTSRP
jgi:hypothetical protein